MPRKKYYEDNVEQLEEKKNGVYKTGLYIRISREDGDKAESDSVTNQRKLLTNYVNEKTDMIIGDMYIDDGYTGTNFDRPGFQRLIDDIKSGLINCVIVKDLSRFGRDYIQAGNYLEQLFPFLNCRFISILDNLDSLERPEEMNSIFVRFKHIMNDYYSSEISKKVRKAFDDQRKEGKLISAFAPYGYKKDPRDIHHLIVDHEVVDIVRDIFNWYVNGMGVIRIAHKLNDLKILSPGMYRRKMGIYKSNHCRCGELWRPQTITKMLKNKTYIGCMDQKRHTTLDYKNRKKIYLQESERIFVENTHQAIIDKSTFEKVQSNFARCTRTPPYEKRVYLFSGFLRCADCRHAMIRSSSITKGKAYTYYKCRTYNQVSKAKCPQSHSINHDLLVSVVKHAINTQIYTVINMKNVISKVREDYIPKTNMDFGNEIRLRRKRMKEKRKLKIGLYEDLKSGLISKQEYLDMKQKYDSEINELEESIEKLNQEENEAHHLEEKNLIWMKQFEENYNIKELSRDLLISLVEMIYINADKSVNIQFKYQDEFKKASSLLSRQISV